MPGKTFSSLYVTRDSPSSSPRFQINHLPPVFVRDLSDPCDRNPPLRQLMLFYHITGCRKTEGLILQWPQVDFPCSAVIFNPGTTKNDEGRVFLFTEELRELLTDQRAATDKLQREKGAICPWVFHRNGKRIKSYDGALRSACRKAGLPCGHVDDFRRTTVRRVEQAGISRSVE